MYIHVGVHTCAYAGAYLHLMPLSSPTPSLPGHSPYSHGHTPQLTWPLPLTHMTTLPLFNGHTPSSHMTTPLNTHGQTPTHMSPTDPSVSQAVKVLFLFVWELLQSANQKLLATEAPLDSMYISSVNTVPRYVQALM